MTTWLQEPEDDWENPVLALDDWADNLTPHELPLATQLMLAGVVAVVLSPPLIVAGVALNAWRRWRR